MGEWERETTCAELVRGLREAGMDEVVDEFVAGNGFIPGMSVDEPEQIDLNDPCKGAVPRVHSHFFTEDGELAHATGRARTSTLDATESWVTGS